MNQYCHSIMSLGDFSEETAMRRGEILSMERKDIFDVYVHLPKTKNGDPRIVPLSEEAKELLQNWLSMKVVKLYRSQRMSLMWEKKKNHSGAE